MASLLELSRKPSQPRPTGARPGSPLNADRLVVLRLGLGRDSMAMLALLGEGRLVVEGLPRVPSEVDAVVFTDPGHEWPFTMALMTGGSRGVITRSRRGRQPRSAARSPRRSACRRGASAQPVVSAAPLARPHPKGAQQLLGHGVLGHDRQDVRSSYRDVPLHIVMLGGGLIDKGQSPSVAAFKAPVKSSACRHLTSSLAAARPSQPAHGIQGIRTLSRLIGSNRSGWPERLGETARIGGHGHRDRRRTPALPHDRGKLFIKGRVQGQPGLLLGWGGTRITCARNGARKPSDKERCASGYYHQRIPLFEDYGAKDAWISKDDSSCTPQKT